MVKKVIMSVIMLTCLLLIVPASHAIPTLQLDIQGGYYDSSTQTIMSNGSPFTLYAYLIPDSGALLTNTYYISAAVVPQVGPTGQNIGSFAFNGTPINVTSDMVYGTPPIETVATQLHDSHDLSTHSIFETYFKQFSFMFNSSNKATAYNTQDNTGVGPTPNPSGSMYYQAFTIDTSSLLTNYAIHFDLYNTLVANGGDIDVKSFAPFSHDAQSGHKVPEPSTLLLLDAGLAGVGIVVLLKRRQKTK